eukprot:1159081-Pelagomonas_calceolata.AAC.14
MLRLLTQATVSLPAFCMTALSRFHWQPFPPVASGEGHGFPAGHARNHSQGRGLYFGGGPGFGFGHNGSSLVGADGEQADRGLYMAVPIRAATMKQKRKACDPIVWISKEGSGVAIIHVGGSLAGTGGGSMAGADEEQGFCTQGLG